MPRRSSRPATAPTKRGYARLEQQLSLLAWLHRRLGYKSTADLLTDLKESNEGFDPEGRSYIYKRLEARSERWRGLDRETLQSYDNNIREHLAAINTGRVKPITLRYFQYLAALYAEIYLDSYCRNPDALLGDINNFIVSERRRWLRYAREDLSKLAFWMATGSGKTLLLHLNYRQFLHYHRHYNLPPLDNILLITPNEGLSQQHLNEMQLSGILASRFELNSGGGLLNQGDAVRVTEITKLVLEKSGEGERIPVEVFEGNNLIFVDEGHKGSGGEAWRAARAALGKTGFTIEYSATFGQALAAAKDDSLLTEYGRAIAFDYSYRHFYQDGYGKDFLVLNLQQETTADQTDLLLLANMLSFHQQQQIFAKHREAMKAYNMDKPLWTFIGGSVNAVYQESRRPRSDVLTVCRFLQRVLREADWATENIGKLLSGQSGLVNPNSGQDLFADKLDYLRNSQKSPATLYKNLLRDVLHASGSGNLRLAALRSSPGELGLKAADAVDYFGVVYIGDTAKFKQLVAQESSDITIDEDALSSSLFGGINRPETTVEVLVGSRKFMEGWNSWRVSNMGLLNIGRSEGSQIIQLFGRGVRLPGRDWSLKRSAALPEISHPEHIRLLETLNIFAIRANYMTQFRDYLESEGIDTGESVQLSLPVRLNQDFLNQGLVIPRWTEKRDFRQESVVVLEADDNMSAVLVDLSATVREITSNSDASSLSDAESTAGGMQTIPSENLALVDWDAVYLALLEYKQQKGYGSLGIQPDKLPDILETQEPILYELVADDEVVDPQSHAGRERLQEAALNILRKYADALHRRRRSHWEAQQLVYKRLDETDPNFQLNAVGEEQESYTVRVSGEQQQALAKEIERLIADCEALYEQDGDAPLPRIHFSRHLYQPLLVETDGSATVSPPGLNAGEQTFVRDLRDFWAQEQDRLPADTELFLLRNLSRGRGVGFFESHGFYPDFILWIKNEDRQRIVFIEPHGMYHESPYRNSEKARLHERLPELAREITTRSEGMTAALDSFILSTTPYPELQRSYDDGSWDRERFAEKHILFLERSEEYDYIRQLLQAQLAA